MADRKPSQMLPGSGFVMPSLDMATSGQRLYENTHADATNRAFADAFATNFPQNPSLNQKRNGLAQILVEQGMPFEQAMAQAIDAIPDAPPGAPAPSAPSPGSQMPPISAPADLGALGRNGDTMVAHINPQEAALLEKSGGSGTINPRTGLPEFYTESRDRQDTVGGGNRQAKGGPGAGSRSGAAGGNRGPDMGALSNITGQQPMGASAATVSGPTTSYGAPVHTDQYGSFARTPDRWAALTDQVDKYNQAARAWNATTARSFGNFVNRAQPFGFTMEAPDLSKPKTYVGGDYHLGLNPLGLAGSLASLGTGIPGIGTVAGGLYDAAGGPHVMLGGGAVPAAWQGGLGKNATAPDNSSSAGTGLQSPGRGEAGGSHLLPAIAGTAAASPGMPPAAPSSGSLLPPINAPARTINPGAYLSIAGPTPYGWRRPEWSRAA